MKLYDMIQVYSSSSTVIMNMHCIWPVLHMTSCLVAINKNREMCFWYEKWQKNIFQWGNPSERLSECVEGVEIYKINLKKIFTYVKKFMQRIIQKWILKKFLSAVQPWRLWILCIIWKPGPDWEGWIEWCFSCKISFGWYKVAEKGEGQGYNKEWWWCNILFLSKILTICQLVLQ